MVEDDSIYQELKDEISKLKKEIEILKLAKIEGNNLQKSISFLYNIFQQSPYPTWISDLNGTLIHINQANL